MSPHGSVSLRPGAAGSRACASGGDRRFGPEGVRGGAVPEPLWSVRVRGGPLSGGPLRDRARSLLGLVPSAPRGGRLAHPGGLVAGTPGGFLCAVGGACLGAALTAVPGSSDVVLGGVIAYSNAIKQSMLGVPADLLDCHGAVSGPVAQAMAEGVRRCTGADWGVAITGIAGPGGGSPEKPVGLVHLAVSGPKSSSSSPCRFGHTRGRDWVRRLSAGEALDRLRLQLLPQA